MIKINIEILAEVEILPTELNNKLIEIKEILEAINVKANIFKLIN